MNDTIDFSIFKNFNFKFSPVGVKFLLTKPVGVEHIEKKLAFCEMLKEAQEYDRPFYTTAENHECKAGPILLGMEEGDPIFESGQVGPRLGVYEDPRANRKLYTNMSKFEKNSVNYVLYSKLDTLNFNPDLLILTADADQAEIIMRAYTYRSGAAWNAKGTTVVGCAFLYLYPYFSGELNMMVTGLHHGMKARKLFPPGWLFLSIPYNAIPEVAENLKTIEWDLPQYSWGKENHLKRMQEIVAEVKEEL